jgi:hypothetical protein
MAPDRLTSNRAQRSVEHWRYFKLWVIVSLLWAAATVLRAVRMWVPIDGWTATLQSWLLWIELALPPLMFGSIILAVRQIRSDHRALRSSGIWRRGPTSK